MPFKCDRKQTPGSHKWNLKVFHQILFFLECLTSFRQPIKMSFIIKISICLRIQRAT